MPIDFSCNCGKRFRVEDHLAGKRVRCKQCGHELLVPSIEPEVTLLEEHDEIGIVAEPPPSPRAPSRAASRPGPSQQQPQSVPASSGGLADWLAGWLHTGTYASNPARTHISFLRYNFCYPAYLIASLLGLAVEIAIGWYRGYWWLALSVAAIALLSYLRDMFGEWHKLRLGDVNPALVISQRPWRIAVYADMSRIGSLRPAIWISNQPLGRMTDGPVQVGSRLATVATYRGIPEDAMEAWVDIDPTVLNCATNDVAEIRRVEASIPESDWAMLHQYLRRLPNHEPGLYKLWRGTANTYGSQSTRAVISLCVILGVGIGIYAVLFGKPRTPSPGTSAPPATVTPPPVAPPARAIAPPPPARPTTAAATARPGVVAPPVPAPAPPDVPAPIAAIPPTSAPAVSAPPAAPQPPDATRPPSTPHPTSPAPRIPRFPSRHSPRTPAPAPEPAAPPAPAQPGTFKPGQKVQIFWGSTWYPGSIVRAEGAKFRVHYDGWSDSFDETVTPDRLREVK